MNAILGGISRDGAGNIISAESVSGMWETIMNAWFDTEDGMRRKFPVSLLWERDAMCILGFNSLEDRDKLASETTNCGSNQFSSPLETRLYFGRSLPDEFQRTLGSDQALIGVAIMLIVIYLVIMLGKLWTFSDKVFRLALVIMGVQIDVL